MANASGHTPALARIHDFDDLVRLFLGWQGTFTQLSRGRFEGTMRVARSGRILAHSATTNQQIHARGREARPFRSFGIVLPINADCLWQGRRAPAGTLIARGPETQVNHRTGRNIENLHLAIDEDALRSAARSLGYGLETLSWAILQPDPAHFRVLEVAMRRFLATPPVSWERNAAERSCVAALVEALAPPARAGYYDPPAHVRAGLLRRAEERMRAALSGGLDEFDLCDDLGVSGRTLRLAFREQYGFGPMDYYRTLRLNEARQALKKVDPRQFSVASLAEAYGFHHPGKFAGYYRRLFGELPSQALRV